MSRWSREPSPPEPKATNPEALAKYEIDLPEPRERRRPLPDRRDRWCAVCEEPTTLTDDWKCARCGASLEQSLIKRNCDKCGRWVSTLYNYNEPRPLLCRCEQLESDRRREDAIRKARARRDRRREVDAYHAATARRCWAAKNHECELKTDELDDHCYTCIRPAIAKGKVRARRPDYDQPLRRTNEHQYTLPLGSDTEHQTGA
jgi:hypothetical protein